MYVRACHSTCVPQSTCRGQKAALGALFFTLFETGLLADAYARLAELGALGLSTSILF